MAEIRNDFERYPKLKIEEKRLSDRVEMLLQQRDQLRARVVIDTVQASDKDYPYVMHTISVEGLMKDTDKTENRKIHNELRRIRRQQEANDLAMSNIKNSVEKIPDEYIRAIVTYRFLRGMSWQQVAFRIGGGISPDGVRKAYQRYFSEKK